MPTLSPPIRREITRASLAALVSLLLAACARAQVVDGRCIARRASFLGER
jgi:hypothetical protein